MILTKAWWKAAGVRALKTFAQAMIGSIAVGAAIAEVQWGYILSVSFVAALLSLLTSIAGLPEVEDKDGKEETDTDA